MIEKHLKILLLLDESNEWRPSKKIAQRLGYSQRSVKNYIQQINQLFSEAIISSKKGYRLNTAQREKIFQYFDIEPIQTFQSIESRRKYLLLNLLKTTQPLNIFDLSEQLYTSVTTVKKDIQALNNEIDEYNIKIVSAGDYLKVIGEENEKRRTFIDQVYGDTDSLILTEETIQQLFPDLKIFEMKTLINNSLVDNDLFVDEYALISILLHVTLFIEQMRGGTNSSNAAKIVILDEKLYDISKQLAAALQDFLKIEIEESEIYEIYILLLAKTSTAEQKRVTREDIERFVNDETIVIVEKILSFLKDFYVIDLKDESFYIPFVLHINSLLTRARVGHFLKNPLLTSIKNGQPFIYELAVSVTSIISEFTQVKISDDEIGYIALHLGGAFSKENQKYHKLVCALLVPEVRTLAPDLKKKLESQFNDTIYIERVYTTNFDQRELANFDLIISTIPIRNFDSSTPVVAITPFFTSEDQKKIYFKIDEIKLKRTYQDFKDNLNQIVDNKYFMKNTVLKTREEVIEVVADILVNEKVAQEDFKENVLARERMSSTAFNNIAIPHTFKMNALQSKMYIIVSERAISWGKKDFVNLVFLFAISEQDKQIFYNVFEILSLLFANEENTLEAINKKNFADFINFLLHQEQSLIE
ncbi:BglG family transcription antiterminator [Enterococcus hulanensis]|uniref:BglG family transcription antiterminator n=1 Tax=Enterococcus hulanensis TaxID=2559929 RepID=A0ABU3EZ72_9ENTE|nr:BglG family transcription antiterminator [Enterococcus hulanensis]MDT2600164.1 BglG family transcription antiterminator [Enterococcus hulanensis]MDT2608977.1 BglG family transcription antiterminator [Enterococcus hulanensis]MDT2616981.1 BglG family transcription antiterminator [Enterococcus hulanensis]MDT2628499.1 BglG family transcription antiterminator [Enterococcus hulanensis]MDT2655839.1 BglG family transcription antiterminator [Enterococcus hulanensis]